LISEDKIAELRERTDLVALVGEYVRLKKSGVSFKGLCPFHNEKTPSFYVHPQRGLYHCFGCAASGDALSFLMRLEGLRFPEALRRLAERVGMELPDQDPAESAEYQRQKKKRERLVDAMDAAAGYYVAQLAEHPLGQMARAALEARAVSGEAAARFRLGYAPAEWDGLARFLERRGASLEDAAELGLLVPRRSGKGYYDRFRHRLMFPIADVHGRIIAFSGRALPTPPGEAPPDEPPAKYINSPEGPLYKKGEVLYGLYEGRVEIRRRGLAVLCEGNFDLVALHQAGFPYAVAPMGTALTEAHARLLRRFAERALLLFDGDSAGRRAVRAAYPLLQKVGVSSQVVELPSGDDPDSFLRAQGKERLQERLDNAPAVVPYLIDRAAADSGGDPRAKAEAIAELGPLLLSVDNPVEIPLYVEKIGQKFGIADLAAVRRQLQQGARRARNPAREGEKPTAAEPSGERKPPVQPFVPPPLQAELFCAILDNPELFRTDEAKNLSELLTNPDLRSIFRATSRMVEQRGAIDGPELLRSLEGSPALAWLEGRLARQDRQDLGGARQILRDGIPRLAQQNIERELPRVSGLVLEARRSGDEALATALTQELVELTRTAHKLKQGSTKR
jgi:DNA primase